MVDTGDELTTRWSALAETVGRLAKAVAAADKAVRGVEAPAADPPAARQALSALHRVLEVVVEPPLGAGEVTALEASVAAVVADWHLGWLRQLDAAAGAAGLPFQRLTADEVRVGEATVGFDLDAGEAEVRYAREPLATVRAEPAAIIAAVRRELDALARPIEPAALFAELAAAYRALLARAELPMGERVNLVDLLPALFFVRQPETFWKKQDAKAMRPVTRAQLAYDLDRLHRARALEQNGWRIVLGTATGGTAAKKAQVLFLESAAAGGQYFLSFALKRTGT